MCDTCPGEMPIPRPEDFKTQEERDAFQAWLTDYLTTPMPVFGQIESTKNDDGTVTFKIAKDEPPAPPVEKFFKIIDDVQRKIIEEGLRPYNPMAAVAEWHKAVDQKPAIELDADVLENLVTLRRRLISEEFWEVDEELTNLLGPYGSRAKLAAELADLLYVVYGTADLFEIDLPAVFELVHAKNLEKVDPATGKVIRRADGKILKPEEWAPLTDAEVEAIIN